MAENWLDLGNDARKASAGLIQECRHRSAASRAYYAVYSKITHELVSAGLPMPPAYEGPKHRRIRPVIESSMPGMAADKRVALSNLVGRLYTLRIDADYKPSVAFDAAEAREAFSIARRIFESF